jgi:hypothetical protein
MSVDDEHGGEKQYRIQKGAPVRRLSRQDRMCGGFSSRRGGLKTRPTQGENPVRRLSEAPRRVRDPPHGISR